MDKKLIKQAKKLLKEGKTLEAAEMFELSGDQNRAMETWARARRFDRAAEIAILIGRGDAAAAYYLRGGFYEELAEFYRIRKNYLQAGKYFTHSGHHDKAALQYEEVLKSFPQLRNIPGQKVQRSDEEIIATRYAASSHSKAGHYERAAELYHRLEAFEEAAKNLMEAEDYHGAGEAFLLAGMLAEAGAAFNDGGDHSGAARCYEKEGSLVLAAESYEKDGNFVTAGELYDRAGKPFLSSSAYTEADDLDKATKVLTLIPPDSPRYIDAITAILDLASCIRYITPSALRYFNDFINEHSDSQNEQHFDTLYSIARMMAKSEYQEEADDLINSLRTVNPARLQKHEEKFMSVLESGEHKIDINEILKQDFHAEKRSKDREERQKMLELANQKTNPQLSAISDQTQFDDESTYAMENSPSSDIMTFGEIQIGKKFGPRYLLLEHLGSGGMGSVYKALDLELDEDIALKVLSPQLNLSSKAVQRFKQEIKLARQINHPNVIRIYDIGEQLGLKFISMEYFQGRQLKEIIVDQGFFNPEIGVRVLLDICSSLAAAHKLGIIHRDIKSQNIMMSDDGVVKILDFGIAKSLDIPGLTVESAILGTPEYMSPEAIQQKSVDTRCDIYSVGVVMYEMFTGCVPFTGENFLSVVHAHLHNDPPPMRQYNPTLSEDLIDVILTCLEKDPEDRYQSIAELSAELRMLKSSF